MSNISNIETSQDSWKTVNAGLVACGVFSDKSFTKLAQAIDQESEGIFTSAIDLGDVKGKTGETHLFYIEGKRILLMGLGKKEKYDATAVRLAAGTVVRTAIAKKINSIAVECMCIEPKHCQALGEGLVLGSYQFLDYKTNTDKI